MQPQHQRSALVLALLLGAQVAAGRTLLTPCSPSPVDPTPVGPTPVDPTSSPLPDPTSSPDLTSSPAPTDSPSDATPSPSDLSPSFDVSPSPSPSNVTNTTTLYDVLVAVPELSVLKLTVDALANSTYGPNITEIFNGTSINGTTLFAPDDAAINLLFAELAAFNATGVLQNETVLFAIISAHLVPFAAPSASLTDGTVLPTLLPGVNLTIANNGTNITVISPGSNATVLVADLGDSLHVVHVINAVLLPADLLGLIELLLTPSIPTSPVASPETSPSSPGSSLPPARRLKADGTLAVR